MNWKRIFAVWLIIVIAETIHGVFRQLLIVPLIGDFPARQLGVLVGSVIILIIAILSARWLALNSIRQQLWVGTIWVALMLSFEITLGMMLGLSRERLFEDYNIIEGGFMGLGLLLLFLAPYLGARLRRPA